MDRPTRNVRTTKKPRKPYMFNLDVALHRRLKLYSDANDVRMCRVLEDALEAILPPLTAFEADSRPNDSGVADDET